MERAAAHEPLAPPAQLDTTCRHHGLDRMGAPKRRNVKPLAAGKGHSSIPAASLVVLFPSGVGAAK